MHRRFISIMYKHFNFKMGILSGMITGSIVFAINIGHGFWPAFASFGKQFVFNVFMAGFNTRTCEKLVKSIENNFISIFLATVIPTINAFVILYAIHYFGATPKAMASTIWQAPVNLVIFLFLALVYGEVIKVKSSGFVRITRIFKINPLLPVKRLNRLVKNRHQES